MARDEAPINLRTPGLESAPRWWALASYVVLAVAALSIAAGFGFFAGLAVRAGPVLVTTPPPAAAAPVSAYVAGEVATPGVYTLPAGARVHEFVAAAGGLSPAADALSINMAGKVTDGQRIVVRAVPPRVAAPGAASTTDRPAAPGPINLNAASEQDLAALPRIGPVTAAAIVKWREENGGFDSVDELLKVRGIGQATLDALRPYLTAP